jgi:hypothetical protein
MSQSEDWLRREDTVCFAGRAARLDWIAEIMPTADVGAGRCSSS